MISTFSYPLPDELYVEGVSGDITGTFTYDGPETFDVQIDGSGDVLDIDIQNDPELGPNFRKTIDATKQPEVAYMFAHYFVDDYIVPVPETIDEVMENGDVYKKLVNPDLTTAYQVKYNTQDNDWELIQIVKQQDNPSRLEAERRKEYIQKYADKYSFGIEVDSVIETYISTLDTFIKDNPPLKTWKYTNFNFNLIPKIPVSIAVELSKIPSEGIQ
jgi:hypothetical protein